MNFNDAWGNLRGEPSRWAFASTGKRRTYDGFIKLRLGHSEGRSYLIPDMVIAVGGCRSSAGFISPHHSGGQEEHLHERGVVVIPLESCGHAAPYECGLWLLHDPIENQRRA